MRKKKIEKSAQLDELIGRKIAELMWAIIDEDPNQSAIALEVTRLCLPKEDEGFVSFSANKTLEEIRKIMAEDNGIRNELMRTGRIHLQH